MYICSRMYACNCRMVQLHKLCPQKLCTKLKCLTVTFLSILFHKYQLSNDQHHGNEPLQYCCCQLLCEDTYIAHVNRVGISDKATKDTNDEPGCWTDFGSIVDFLCLPGSDSHVTRSATSGGPNPI